MPRILVLEDEPGIALPLEDALKLEGYDVEVVSNGHTAAERGRNPFDLILLDVMVPGQNGYDVCRELRRADVKTPIIFVTARVQEHERVLGLDLGAHDYVVKPFSVSELMARVRTTLRHADETRADQRRVDSEIRAAAAVQTRLLPQHQPAMPGLDYAAVCRPARGVSGDFFEFLPLDGGRLGLLVADVCGKGMPAALLAAALHAAVRAYARSPGCRCGNLLARANHLLFETTGPERYATVFFAIYDPFARTLSYANAGHHPPWIVSESSRMRLESLTPPVGMFAEIPALDRIISLVSGDWLLIASDGIPEARAETGEEFGDERLLNLLERESSTASAFCSAALEAATSFSAGHPVDDLTLLAARVLR
jgi:sigma-B regulation protein RsbU (phosphoserine phosphatase)